MIIPTIRWPIRALPVIMQAGRYPLDEHNYETTCRHVTHALHLHEYGGEIRMGQLRLILRPGDVTVSKSHVCTQYNLPNAGHHWCIHFYPVKVHGPVSLLPWYIRAASHRGYLADRMAEIARLHNQSRQPIAQARAALLLQDLLIWIAALTAETPRARRSDVAIDKLIALLEERFAERWTVPQLAAAVGMTPDHMAHCFRQRLGQTIPRYLLQRRIVHVRQLLEITDLPINRIAARVGRPDAQHFNKQFRRLTGLSPSAARLASGR